MVDVCGVQFRSPYLMLIVSGGRVGEGFVTFSTGSPMLTQMILL